MNDTSNNENWVNVSEIPNDWKVVKEINTSSYIIIAIMLFFSIFCLFFNSLRVIGIFSLFVIILFTIVNKHKVVIKIFQNALIIYNQKDSNLCRIVYYDDIISWETINDKATGASLKITLRSNEMVSVSLLNSYSVYNALHKIMPGKNSEIRRFAKIKNKK